MLPAAQRMPHGLRWLLEDHAAHMHGPRASEDHGKRSTRFPTAKMGYYRLLILAFQNIRGAFSSAINLVGWGRKSQDRRWALRTRLLHAGALKHTTAQFTTIADLLPMFPQDLDPSIETQLNAWGVTSPATTAGTPPLTLVDLQRALAAARYDSKAH